MNGPIWVTFARGGWSIVLGLALLLEAERGRSSLLNFMALYWLTTSVFIIRASLAGIHVRRFSLATGIVGVTASVIALGRSLLGNHVGAEAMLSVLGAVIFVTGIFHAVNGFLERHRAKRSWAAIALGAFEIILGLLLVIAPYARSSAVIVAAGSWAILGGIALLLEALSMRWQAAPDVPKEAQPWP